MKMKTLREIYPTTMQNGILHWLTNNGAPWGQENTYDLIYVTQRSGNKAISPFTESVLGDNETLTPSNVATIGTVLLSYFRKKWEKLWATTVAEYNPIENYDMNETTVFETERDSSTDETEFNSKNTNTVDMDDTTTLGTTLRVNNNDKIHGFNSSQGKPATESESVQTGEGTDTVNHSGTNENARTGKDTRTITNDKKNKTTINRHGNMGVTTTQQMLQSERDLWKWNYLEQVMKDIDSIVVLPIYP